MFRKFSLALLIMILFPFSANAVVLQIVELTDTHITVTNAGLASGINHTIDYNTLQPGSDDRRAQELEDRLNAFAIRHELRSSIDLLEPTRVEDPGGFFGERFYWCDLDRDPQPRDDVAGTHICSRADIIDVSGWVGGVPIVSIRNARNCVEDPTFLSCLP